MGNIEETISNLERKIEELGGALKFKVEENAALKEIIAKIDGDSKDFKEKITHQIEENLTHKYEKQTRMSPNVSEDINDDFFGEFSKKGSPSTTVATEKDNQLLKES